MKLFASTAALLTLIAAPALAQTTPTPAPTAAAPAAPVVAYAECKKVLDADLPGLTTNDKYDMFKSMSLNQVAGFAPDKLTPERMAKVGADLGALKKTHAWCSGPCGFLCFGF